MRLSLSGPDTLVQLSRLCRLMTSTAQELAFLGPPESRLLITGDPGVYLERGSNMLTVHPTPVLARDFVGVGLRLTTQARLVHVGPPMIAQEFFPSAPS